MMGGVYSAWRETKVMRARIGDGQPSQLAWTAAPAVMRGSAVSGTKKRSFTALGGKRLITGAPAWTHSPGE